MPLRKFLRRGSVTVEVKATRTHATYRKCPKGYVRCKLLYPQTGDQPPVTVWELVPEREYQAQLVTRVVPA